MNITIRFEDYEYQTATILEVSVQFDEVCDQMFEGSHGYCGQPY